MTPEPQDVKPFPCPFCQTEPLAIQGNGLPSFKCGTRGCPANCAQTFPLYQWNQRAPSPSTGGTSCFKMDGELTASEGLVNVATRMYFVSRLAARKNFIPPEKQDTAFRDAPPEALVEWVQGGGIVLEGVLSLLDRFVQVWDEPVTAENHAAKLARVEALMNSTDPVDALELRLTAHAVEHYERIAFPLCGRFATKREVPHAR